VKSEVVRALESRVPVLGLAGRRILVALSGGLDSVVLLHGLHAVRERFSISLGAAHVHHGLRGEAADQDEAHARGLAEALGVPFRSARVDPAALRRAGPSRARPTLQEAARRLRYAALFAVADELRAHAIATAHHADDQAETVLLRILRGSGPDGLGGIPDRSPDGRLVRPLLELPRSALRAHAEAHGLAWREDASNDDPHYARNRLRKDWLPGLAGAFNPRLLRALADLAEAQRRDSEWIEAAVDEVARAQFEPSGGGLRIEGAGWAEMPEALARRLARRALIACGAGRDVSRPHLARMLRFLRAGRSGTAIELPGGLVLARDRRGFSLGPRRVEPEGAC
jgi:tRNA(Ile)-lysidine synthase